MKFAAALALAGFAAAGRVPLVHNPLSAADYAAQKDFLVRRAQAHVVGESLDLKDYMNTQYFVEVELGSDHQKFTVVPDTGSSNLWVYSSNCHAIACKTHSKYNPDTSTTYEADGQDFDITYGSGSITGYTSKDNAWLGDIEAPMTFGEIQKVKGATFLVSQMDGIIGLGYDTISVDSIPTWIEQTDLSDKSFAFYMHNNPEESYITIPGIDAEAALEKIATHDVIEQTYWNVNFTKMSGPNGDVDTTGYRAAIDSGTSLIMGPNTLIAPLIEGITVEQDCTGVEDLPDITFTFDDTDYVLTVDDYVLKITQGSSTQCIMGIAGADLPDDFKYVIVGDVFMRPYPTHFNRDDNTVTFYKA